MTLTRQTEDLLRGTMVAADGEPMLTPDLDVARMLMEQLEQNAQALASAGLPLWSLPLQTCGVRFATANPFWVTFQWSPPETLTRHPVGAHGHHRTGSKACLNPVSKIDIPFGTETCFVKRGGYP